MQWLKAKVVTPLTDSVRNGISVETLAFSLALGIVAGVVTVASGVC